MGFHIWMRIKAMVRTWSLRNLLLHCIVGYICAVVLSVALAHLAAILAPGSEWPERLIAPVRDGLVFLDDHWRAVLFVVLPVLAPEILELMRRVRAISAGKYQIELIDAGVRQKPKKEGQDNA